MARRKRRTFNAEFKFETVMEALRGEKSSAQICRERDISENLLSRWKSEFVERGAESFEKPNGKAASSPTNVLQLPWSAREQQQGKLIHIKDFPKGHQVKLFRLVLSTERTDFIATNDGAQDSSQGTQDVCALRWKIEQFHRESKQITGIERCQCRLARIQRNHIDCAILVWIRLKAVAQHVAATLYHLKQSLLDDFMRSQLRSPAIRMQFA